MKKYIALITAISLTTLLCSCGSDSETAAPAEQSVEVETTTGSVYIGALSPVSEVKVISNGKGQIESCPYEIGDHVEKGALLYRIDDNGLADSIATTKNSIKKANLSISTAQENVSNLKVYAPASGILRNFNIKTGERVNAAKIAEIANEEYAVAVVPFNAAQKEKIHIGDAASVTSAELMGSINGSVTKIYDSRSSAVAGSNLYDIEITVKNNGTLYSGMSVGARIGNDIESPVSGKIKDSDTVSVVSKGSGNAAAVHAEEGQFVKKGTLLVEIENSSLSSSLQRAYLDKNDLEIKLAALEKDYADLFVYAPAGGTITAKHKGLNDNITSNTESIMTISDDSTLVLKVDVDEHTLPLICTGDTVTLISADSGASASATISDIGQTAGISSGSKLYPVTVTVSGNAGLSVGEAVSVDFGGDK